MKLLLGFLPALPLALACLPVPAIHAADGAMIASNAPAGVAFSRYVASLGQAQPWSLETIEIDASLPKLEKKGRLRAIRHLLPSGKPQYQVLESVGDQTVKRQVIVRYLDAEERSSAIPAASVAITPANYKFRYAARFQTGDTVAYIFQITPRKKRDGLIKGELWLNEAGKVVRESGCLVNKPSIFLKRVEIDRETTFQDEAPATRVTHVSVDTRLVGRAELTIQERPYDSPNQTITLGSAQ